jgi:YVTN family beta-propeller protein
MLASMISRRLFCMSAFAADSIRPGNTILVGQKMADSVGIYDAADGKRLATVPVGVKPHEMVFSADRKLVYVTNYGVDRWTQTEPGEHTISIVDPAARKEVGRIDISPNTRPHGIELGHRTGRLYITTDLPPSVLVIDPGRRTVVRRIAIGQQAPHMLAVTRDEARAYVANSASGTVTVLDLTGKVTPRHVSVGGVPMGIVVNHEESRAYVATRTGNEVVAINVKSGAVDHRIAVAGNPVRLKFLPGGKDLVVTTIESGEVVIVDTAARKELTRFKGGTHNEGIHIDGASAHLYVSAQGDNAVIKYEMKTWTPVLRIATASRPDPILQF